MTAPINPTKPFSVTGILLAAGHSRRFGSNKLIHQLDDGLPLAIQCAEQLKPHVDRLIAIIRAEDKVLHDLLSRRSNIDVIKLPQRKAPQPMGNSIAAASQAVESGSACILALADMPYIQTSTYQILVEQLRCLGGIVRPRYQGQAGHPVGFAPQYLNSLTQCTGHQGAKHILDSNPTAVHCFDVSDEGVIADIDAPQDIKI